MLLKIKALEKDLTNQWWLPLLLSIIRISPSMEEEELNVAQTAYLVTL